MEARYRILFTFLLSMLLGLSLPSADSPAAENGDPFKAPNCLSCHKYSQAEKLILGDFQSYSRQANLITVKIGPRVQTVKFTPQTKVENAPGIKEIPAEASVKILFEEKPDGLQARQVVVKPKIKVPENQIISLEEMVKLVALGPEKGNYTLIDSRPGYRYQEDRLPGAISMPFPNFDKLTHLLPQDKDRLVIFYCGGFS